MQAASKRSLSNLGCLVINPTPMLPTLNTSVSLSQMNMQLDGRIEQPDTLLMFDCSCCGNSDTYKKGWCVWDCDLRLCQDRTSCATLVTAALLQRCACFDLTRFVFEKQILPFCSHRSRLYGLTRWKIFSRGEGSPFFFPFGPGFFFFSVVRGNHFLLRISAL